MVNHVRTLLLNLRAQPSGTELPAEEYIPPDFVPVALTADLELARTALFGNGADRVGMNINLARLLLYAHSSVLAADVVASDPRTTYDRYAVAGLWDSLGQSASTLSGDAAIAWGGAPTFLAEGRGYGRWTLSASGGGTYSSYPPGLLTDSVATSVGDAMPIPETNLALVVPSYGAGTYEVTLLVAPPYKFDRVIETGDPAAVFRPGNNASEQRWYDVWNSASFAALRACAFALALAARIDDLRNNTDPER